MVGIGEESMSISDPGSTTDSSLYTARHRPLERRFPPVGDKREYLPYARTVEVVEVDDPLLSVWKLER